MKTKIRNGIKFLLFKLLFPLCYAIGAMRKRKEKAVFIELQGSALSSNFGELWNYFEKHQAEFDCPVKPVAFYLNYKKNDLGYYGRCFRLLWEISDAAYLFLNDSCNVLGSFRMRKGTQLVQLWHACGAFKKWGFSIAEASYGESLAEMKKYPYHKNYTFVTVSSKTVAWAYAEAFGLPIERIEPLGVSRTDRYFKQEFREAARKHFYKKYPMGKKVILYAPTFRGDRNCAKTPQVLDYKLLYEQLGDEYLFIEKRHPFVKEPLAIPYELEDFLYWEDVLPMEELLYMADLLITDYSSVIFDYSLFERPMLFLAYDLEEYYDERGFYYDYREFVPGKIVKTTGEAAKEIDAIMQPGGTKEGKEAVERAGKFRQSFMAACDGEATKRIVEHLLDALQIYNKG